MNTPPDWFAPDGMSEVRCAQCEREWANRHRAMRSLPRSGRDAQRLGPEGIERGDGRSPAGALMPANDEFANSGTAVLWLIDKLWDDQLTPSDKGDEG